MTFTHCSIVGLGLLGGSLAIDLRHRFPRMTLAGIARRRNTLDAAAALRADGAPVFTHLSAELETVRDTDLIIFCTPVQTVIQQLADIATFVSPGAVVTDVGSTKRMVMNAAATALPAGVFFVGGHPMAGSDRAGLSHARAGLYRGATWALCIPAGAEDAAGRFSALVEAIGARPLPIDADLHDRIVALTSHLPHVVACALAAQVLGHPEGELARAFIAGGFRDTTRIAAANTAMWRDIALTNRDNIARELTEMIAALEQWRDALRNGDAPHLEALLTRAHTLREDLNR
jgi:prephenate dehydrogenase